jgi:hypothetical protein
MLGLVLLAADVRDTLRFLTDAALPTPIASEQPSAPFAAFSPRFDKLVLVLEEKQTSQNTHRLWLLTRNLEL